MFRVIVLRKSPQSRPPIHTSAAVNTTCRVAHSKNRRRYEVFMCSDIGLWLYQSV